jgi:hypothetical protein
MKDVSTLKAILTAQGGLSLWEVRAALNGTRDSVQQALFWMAAHKEIVFGSRDQGLCVELARGTRRGVRT